MTRFLFSALIDADRLNSAERKPASIADWQPLIDHLEDHLAGFAVRNRIDEIRNEISTACLQFATRERGLFQLTVLKSRSGRKKRFIKHRRCMNHW